MPHLFLEYTDNLPQFNAAETLFKLNETLLGSGQFGPTDIKARATRLDLYQVGVQDMSKANQTQHAFLHVRLALLSGRTPEVKKELSDSLMAVLKASCTWPDTTLMQMTVEMLDMDRPSYGKQVFAAKEQAS
ncbi:5-carboxymethyl-2-hydroxymuconate Delta-isomerase [Herbaspirillum lusitanum]|jgi:5-carboxymethyl-2-hydroxymuconate isomerase|uniref:5-carboxymethyl-2-hydroxymuconate Delta-isomerase n=1 Tax=Herbaspirillum lusitanum TaxID=213312 RepID=A0ABW9ABL6_9BURK